MSKRPNPTAKRTFAEGPLVDAPAGRNFCRDLSCLRAVPDYWRALTIQEDDLTDEIASWLGQLAILSGVPFNYLVPDPKMLPPESLRFFFVDPNWISALLDGACSLGRVTTQDAARDAAVADYYDRSANARSLNIRRARLKQGPLPARLDSDQPTTGFLLRSAVVAGWPGLEVDGFLDKKCTQPAQMLRMVRLSRDVLLCLFDGKVEAVNIHEPREGITFGGRPTTGGGETTYEKVLRGIGCGKTPPGDEIPDSTIPIPMRGGTGSERVVDVAALKDTMVAKLTGLGEWSDNCHHGVFTSAEFTLEIVQGADQQHFIDDTPPPPALQGGTDAMVRPPRSGGDAPMDLATFLKSLGGAR